MAEGSLSMVTSGDTVRFETLQDAENAALSPGTIVYVEDEATLYYEDGGYGPTSGTPEGGVSSESVSGLFQTESHDYTKNVQTITVDDVTFDNVYYQNAVSISVSCVGPDVFAEPSQAKFDGYITDADGNVTGCRVHQATDDTLNYINVQVMGVPVGVA